MVIVAVIAQIPAAPGRTLGTRRGPEVAQLAAELLTSGGPVLADVVAQVLHVALEL